MKFQELFTHTSCSETEARTYSALELYLNPGSPSGWSSHREGISTVYNPDFYTGNGAEKPRRLQILDFPFFVVDRQELEIFEANPSAHLRQFFSQTDDTDEAAHLRVILHPDALRQLPIKRKPDGIIQAYLTVATRTVLTTYEHAPIFLKLDYPGIIGRCPRRLDRPQLHTSTFFSQTFDEWWDLGLFSDAFGYLPESFAMLWKFDADEDAVGLIGREFTPRPLVNDRRICIPFFALPSCNQACPDEPSLLTQIIRLNTSTTVTSRDVFLQITGLIFEAIQSLFAWGQTSDRTLTKYRLIHDCHGQNLLLELDEQGKPRRVIFRDFQHIYPVVYDDSASVDSLVGHNPFAKILNLLMDPDYVPCKLSQLIDHKLGKYVIEQLVDEFCAHFDCDRDMLITEIRSQFLTLLGELHTLLPKDRWYRRSDGMEYDQYGRIRLVKGEGTPLLRDF